VLTSCHEYFPNYQFHTTQPFTPIITNSFKYSTRLNISRALNNSKLYRKTLFPHAARSSRPYPTTGTGVWLVSIYFQVSDQRLRVNQLFKTQRLYQLNQTLAAPETFAASTTAAAANSTASAAGSVYTSIINDRQSQITVFSSGIA
jgi:hypothetical protein